MCAVLISIYPVIMKFLSDGWSFRLQQSESNFNTCWMDIVINNTFKLTHFFSFRCRTPACSVPNYLFLLLNLVSFLSAFLEAHGRVWNSTRPEFSISDQTKAGFNCLMGTGDETHLTLPELILNQVTAGSHSF